MKKITAITMLILCFSVSLPLFADNLEDGLYAVIATPRGDITVQLEYEKAPLTVMNFVGLAEGLLDTSYKKGKPFYDGLTFHRVVADFVIQGGDPNGNGSGGPGYNFPDEFHPDLKHNAEGILSMANSGPGTNGSQFFITLSASTARHLDGRHSVFGKVIAGMDVVKSIGEGDVIRSVKIKRIGQAAKNFVVSQTAFDALIVQKKDEAAAAEKKRTEQERKLAPTIIPGSVKSDSGLYYKMIAQGEGRSPQEKDKLLINLTGAFLDGRVFASTGNSGPAEIVLQNGTIIPGLYEVLAMLKKGGKVQAVFPPELAFGSAGYSGVIPPDSFLYYEVELVDIITE